MSVVSLSIEPPALSQRKRPLNKARSHAPKYIPFTRHQLDSRSQAAKVWDKLSRQIISDCGGEANCSAVKLELISVFCCCSIQLKHMGVKALLGENINLSDLSLAASTLVRIAARIGIERTAREIVDDPLRYAQDEE
jgi:hypothetical protein